MSVFKNLVRAIDLRAKVVSLWLHFWSEVFLMLLLGCLCFCIFKLILFCTLDFQKLICLVSCHLSEIELFHKSAVTLYTALSLGLSLTEQFRVWLAGPGDLPVSAASAGIAGCPVRSSSLEWCWGAVRSSMSSSRFPS